MPSHRQQPDDSVSFREDDDTLSALFGGPRGRTETRHSRRWRGILALVVSLAILGGLVWGIWKVATSLRPEQLLPEQCTALAGGHAVVLTHDQMHFAALVAGVAVREGVGERGAAIALATALQESSLRNLDHGDRDSLGLFQQRPSQGWGTPEQIRDPFYATETFLAAMQEVDWQSGSINDVAQEVQRSGVPDGYAKREPDALALAAVFTGSDPAATLTCLDRQGRAPNPAGFVDELNQTWGVQATATGAILELKGATPEIARAWASFAVANCRQYGVVDVVVADREWALDEKRPAEWDSAGQPLDARQVRVTFRT